MLPTNVLSSVPVEAWIISLVALAIARLLFYRFKKGFAKYNGPFLASFTDLWRVFHTYTHMNQPPMLDIHQKYGDIVRIGPNTISFGKPEAIKDIYGPGKTWNKSGFYPVQAAVVRGESAITLFSSADLPWHNALRKAMYPYFTATVAVSYEPLIEKTINVFLEQLDSRFSGKKGPEGIIKLEDWLLYFTFDVIGELTYGSRHGFLESGYDSQGIIASSQGFAVYGSVMGPSPFWDRFLRHNPLLLWLERKGYYTGSSVSFAPFVEKRMKERIMQQKNTKNLETKESEDLLDKFLKARETHPKAVSEKEVMSLSMTMVFAGAETISITLTALFYYLLKNPSCYTKLQHELDTQLPPRDPSSLKCDVDYTQAQKLPYLHACIQESFRMHPASAVLFERVVPPTGADIAGEHMAGGTVVGVSSWAVHHNKDVFGQDVDTFRPERWLEPSEAQVRLMERSMLHFGAGNHLCLGKNISAIEMYKVVPSLMRTFKIELVDPEKDWKIITTIFTRQEDIDVRIERRR